MASVIEIRPPDESDRQTVKDLFYARSLMERGTPVFKELVWVLHGHPDKDHHVKILPDYCYHILDALKKTYFKSLPGLEDIIYIKDKDALPGAKTIAAAKKVIQLDWRNLGRMLGIGKSCIRFAELEAENGVDGEGFGILPPEKMNDLCTIVFGRQWVEENVAKVATKNPDMVFAEILNLRLTPFANNVKQNGPAWDVVTTQWSSAAMIEFNEGFAEGLSSFLDENNRLTGETNRSGTYAFLVLAWPEIKVMLESDPQKTITDLHEWMLPFMRVGVTPHLTLDQLRGVCAPPSQSGIGLALRPLKTRPSLPSA